MADQFDRAERRARLRRRTTLAVGAVGTLAAVLIAGPIAIAATSSDDQRPAAPTAPPTPGPTDQPSYPTAAPTTPGPTDQPSFPIHTVDPGTR